jgi:hypothetical protein
MPYRIPHAASGIDKRAKGVERMELRKGYVTCCLAGRAGKKSER